MTASPRYQPGPEVESFYHLRGCGLTGRACDGTACFVARHSQGAAHSEGDLRIYCCGRCFEAPGPEFPLLLTAGRTLYQFNAGTMTMRTPNRELRHTDTLDISPEDAARLGLGDGETVRVTSRQGSGRMPLRIDPRINEGELFATFHAGETGLNRLTGQGRDKRAMTPEYKVVAVRVEKNGGEAAHG